MTMRSKSKRFTVSVSEIDYQALTEIAEKHRPPLSLQYLANWALQRLLERAADPQLYFELGNPLPENDLKRR